MKVGKYYITLFLSILMLCCSSENGCNIDGIYVGQALKTSANASKIDYCTELENALDGNKSSFYKLATHLPGGATNYDHGIVLIQLMCRLKDEDIYEMFLNLSTQDKELLDALVSVGIEYGNNDLNCKKIEAYKSMLSET
ncbi:hypothetical protein FUA23_16720 [Neolewinella aurantiaca]|uniref:Uncharacterized protein n=1 Tax=Neolewinella aurantiaca TaxID=2602767 RepID=A0A5C7FT27_9BACT|nr:hypothetical protein [Neolewinella aurantiaca]TXF87901.1 hypothetical protein FUA23_16720 [Neolewinella aurantiaca]